MNLSEFLFYFIEILVCLTLWAPVGWQSLEMNKATVLTVKDLKTCWWGKVWVYLEWWALQGMGKESPLGAWRNACSVLLTVYHMAAVFRAFSHTLAIYVCA